MKDGRNIVLWCFLACFIMATSKNLQFLQNYYSESRVPRNFCFLNRFVRDFPRFFSCLDLLYGEWGDRFAWHVRSFLPVR